jgi:hypothetical protein
MELLRPLRGSTSAAKGVYFNATWEFYLASVGKIPVPAGAEVIKSHEIRRARLFAELRFEYYSGTFDGKLADYERTDKLVSTMAAEATPQVKEFLSQLKSSIHFGNRHEITSPFRWPIFYMDVYPAYTRAAPTFLQDVCRRDQTSPIKWTPKTACATSKLIDYKSPEAAPILAEIDSAVAKEVERTLNSLKTTEDMPTITFVFSGDREIRRKTIVGNTIHTFDFFYKMGWTELKRADAAKIYYAHYKIHRWLYYEYLHKLLIASPKANMTIYFNDDRATSISHFFVALGNILARYNVLFRFEWPQDEPRGLWRIGGMSEYSVEDIISIQCFYFGENHEIFRNNVEAPAAIPAKMTADALTFIRKPANSLYDKLCEVRKAIADDPEICAMAALPSADVEEEVYQRCIAGVKPTGAKFVHIVASPGTGKSTLMRKYPPSEYALIPRDDIQDYFTLGGLRRSDAEKKTWARVEAIMAQYTLLPRRLWLSCRDTFYIMNKKRTVKPFVDLSLGIYTRILRRALEANFPVCTDDVGSIAAKNTYYIYRKNFDIFGRPTRTAFEFSELYKWIIKNNIPLDITALYLHYVPRYNQQYYRFLQEKRIGRVYLNFNSSIYFWNHIVPNLPTINLVAYDANNTSYLLINKGVVDKDAVAHFAVQNKEDQLFNKYFGITHRQSIYQ